MATENNGDAIMESAGAVWAYLRLLQQKCIKVGSIIIIYPDFLHMQINYQANPHIKVINPFMHEL